VREEVRLESGGTRRGSLLFRFSLYVVHVRPFSRSFSPSSVSTSSLLAVPTTLFDISLLRDHLRCTPFCIFLSIPLPFSRSLRPLRSYALLLPSLDLSSKMKTHQLSI